MSEDLLLTQNTGYTTTLTNMQIMHAKGMVTRDEQNRSISLFVPSTHQKDTQIHCWKFSQTCLWRVQHKICLAALVKENPSKDDLENIQAL